EVVVDGPGGPVKGAPSTFPRVPGDGVQPAGPVRAEVALDGGAGDAGEAGDVVVGQALGLEPEDFELALDEGHGVVIALEGDGRQVVVGESEARHGRTPA